MSKFVKICRSVGNRGYILGELTSALSPNSVSLDKNSQP